MNAYPSSTTFLDRCMQSNIVRPVGHAILVMYHRFVYSIPYKLAYLKAQKQQNNTFSILCYPVCPESFFVLYKLVHLLGCRITHDPNSDYDLVIRFEDITHASIDTVLSGLAKQTQVLNIDCTDISKMRVDAVFTEVFGYSTMIDPLTHTGQCVMKSDMNAAHDGRIIMCPIETVTPGYVYQRIINTQVGDLVQDIRVPIIGEKIPFVYLKYRSVNNRFSNTNSSVEIAETHDVLSHQEIEHLTLFCQKIGLNYGELDTLRDRNDGSLYIVDVNNTPSGPPNHLTPNEQKRALNALAATFAQVFLPKQDFIVQRAVQ